jgi:cobalt/nickel transport system permease protein
MSTGVITRTARGFTSVLAQALISEHSAHQRGVLQALDPRVKVVGLLSLVLATALSRHIAVVAVLLALAVALALVSRLSLWSMAKRVWLVAFLFTFTIAVPALFLTPGEPLLQLPGVPAITAQGTRSAAMLLLRVESAVTLSTLLVLTTPWMHLLKALRALMVPVEAIMMLAMTHRYAVLLTETANAMFESRQSRMVGRLEGREQRRLMINSGGVLLSKTLEMGNQVFLAMQARGFRGEIRLLDEFHMRGRDYFALGALLAAAALAVAAGR